MSKNFREGFRLIICNYIIVKNKNSNTSKQHERNDRTNFEQNKLLGSNI